MSAMGGRFDGLKVVDLFAGSGALGLECLSRGAAHCTFVESAPPSLRVLEANIALVDAAAQCRIVRSDVARYLDRPGGELFDLALADPPYGQGWAARLLERFTREPFASEFWVEHASNEDLPEVPGLRTRRYGDTSLSTLTAAESSS
jgi:16S rRNA (guanine966-N2)-methyltransferase